MSANSSRTPTRFYVKALSKLGALSKRLIFLNMNFDFFSEHSNFSEHQVKFF